MTTSVALLGTGLMGFPMARRLLAAGHQLTVWNRDLSKAQPLAEEGARLADSAAAAVSDATHIITMLTD
ncbi:MAG: NAD(P)-binding domain-containing protein, partial [Hoeflea sp.]|nr:NAD(P)-binding domain-containing protein [Hoeflea sp.]